MLPRSKYPSLQLQRVPVEVKFLVECEHAVQIVRPVEQVLHL